MLTIEGFEFDIKRYYTRDHIWALVEGSVVRAGMDDYGVKGLGNIEYLELPEVGDEFKQGEAFGSVESEKWVGQFTIPVSGRIVEVNREVEDDFDLLIESPYEDGWLVVIDPSNLEEELESDFLIYGEAAIKKWMAEELKGDDGHS